MLHIEKMRQKKTRRICCLAMGAVIGILGCGAEDVQESLPDPAEARKEADSPVPGQENAEEAVSVAVGEPEDKALNLTFSLVSGETAMSGLSEEVVAQIAAVNAGEPPADAIGAEVLEGYYALVATYTVLGRDAESGEEITGSGRLTLYIPNLIDGLEEISFLFYDKAENGWKILPAEQVDTKARTVSAILPGSGTLTVIYKRQ